MPGIDWQLAAEIATVVSTVTLAVSAIAVAVQLRQAARTNYFSVTAHLFEIWQSPEFQHDQLFLLHKLGQPNWEDFCAGGRGEEAERALHRVGGYYDRIGNLVQHNIINKDDMLPTIGGYAVAVWHRIEPLVRELRLRENAVLFVNYEALLPECFECYVPGLEDPSSSNARPSVGQADGDALCRIPEIRHQEPSSTAATFSKGVGFSSGQQEEQVMSTHDRLSSGAPIVPDLNLPDSDGVPRSLSEFTASGMAVVLYVQGAYCPFCLRQLSDYAERYSEFRRSAVEVVALSPESRRQSRRLRTGLKLPFAVLSDAKLQGAQRLGLWDGQSKAPNRATMIVDGSHRVRLSTLNDGTKSLPARDVLEYLRNVDRASDVQPPLLQIEQPKPGWLFARALVNLVAGRLPG